MDAYLNYSTFVSQEREPRQNYETLISCVGPRPIAFVSTVSADGVANLAPFSFFNAVCADPPTVMFCPGQKRDGTAKDTLQNVRDTKEFVVNVVPYAIRDAMNLASFSFPPDVDEFEAAGFTAMASRFVKPSRVAESPVQMECKLVRILPIGPASASTHMCLGEVVCFHVADDVCTDGLLDPASLDLIGRMGGDDYATTRDRFVIPKPTRGF